MTVDPYHENLAHFVPWLEVSLPRSCITTRAYRGIFDLFRACALLHA